MEQLPKLCCDILDGKTIFALLALLFLMQLKRSFKAVLCAVPPVAKQDSNILAPVRVRVKDFWPSKRVPTGPRMSRLQLLKMALVSSGVSLSQLYLLGIIYRVPLPPSVQLERSSPSGRVFGAQRRVPTVHSVASP